mgnify:CR=1 FL=1
MQSLRVGVTAGRFSPKIRPNRFLGFSRGFHFLVWVLDQPIREMIDITLLILLILFPVFTIIIGCRLVSYYLSDDFSKGFYWGKFVFVGGCREIPDR